MRELDNGITEPAFRKLFEGFISKVVSLSKEDEELPSIFISNKVATKDKIASLSKVIPHRLELIEEIKQIRGNKNSEQPLDGLRLDEIIQWIEEGNSDFLNKRDVLLFFIFLIYFSFKFFSNGLRITLMILLLNIKNWENFLFLWAN